MQGQHNHAAVQEIKTYTTQKLKEHDLWAAGWRVVFDNTKGRAGAASFRTKTIKLSKYWLGIRGVDKTKDTVLHEVAHALVGPGYGHGRVWQRAAIKVGANPRSRFHVTAEEDAKKTYTWWLACPNGHAKRGYHRRPTAIRVCTVCGATAVAVKA